MKKRIVLVAAAVVLALMGTLAVYSYGKSADKRALQAGQGTTVLVVTKRIAAGTTWADTLKGHYFKQEQYPAATVPASALASTADAAIGSDAVAQADLPPGQFVLRESYGPKTATTGALTIPKGLIAVSFDFSSNADVAGYVGPGAEVVIFLTSKLNKGKDTAVAPGTAGDDTRFTKTLVAHAAVIATSTTPQTTVSGAKDGSTTPGAATVTLALTQRDSERVILGQDIGTLYLGLLSPSSKVDPNDPGVENVGVIKPALNFVK